MAQTRITIAVNEGDKPTIELIRQYLQANRPDSKITTSDVIRYALISAANAIRQEHKMGKVNGNGQEASK